jgi:hypothetical protein
MTIAFYGHQNVRAGLSGQGRRQNGSANKEYAGASRC